MERKLTLILQYCFTRLTALAQSDDNIQDHFKYELTHEPTALFKEGSMRKPQKSKLRQYLLDKHPPVNDCEIEACVVDGGALLHKVKWEAKTMYKEICKQYLEFVKRAYGKYQQVCVVFDSYSSESTSTKGHEHHRCQDWEMCRCENHT